jgi:hypothetical protein
MARSQSQIGLLCETLLTADSDELRSLEAVNTAGMIEGNKAYVVDVSAVYALAPASTTTPNGTTVIAATGGGNWLLREGGDDPVVVRTIDDFPAPVAGVITLAAATMYLVEGDIDVGTNRFEAENGAGIQGGAGAILRGNTGAVLITPVTGGAFRLNNIAIVNSGASPVLVWTGNDSGAQLWMHDVSLTSSGAPAVVLVGGGSSDYVNVYDSRFIGTPHDLQIDDEWAAIMLIGCRFLSINDGVVIQSALGEIGTMQINGCEFIVDAGDTGVTQTVADAVTIGRLTGNLFWGAGAAAGAVSANVATTEWEARGNVNLADF